MPYSFNSDQDLLQLSSQKELIQLYISQIESELKGRVFSLPEYYYLKQDKILDEEKERLKGFISHINQQPFEYIFLITSDSKWRKASRDLDAELVWLPGFSSTEMNQEETQNSFNLKFKRLKC
ncbi:DUF2487 family protein [Piscibacillus salipiscarius]|uniref:DUF2487 family protein n=1 Tax=Piscibacillus salipiscarius TaxID=299480 RepID=UPI0024373D9D|nr:DUF2487 family protein [Piscibacillus salipiscarius]